MKVELRVWHWDFPWGVRRGSAIVWLARERLWKPWASGEVLVGFYPMLFGLDWGEGCLGMWRGGRYLRRTQWMVTLAMLSRLEYMVAEVGYMLIEIKQE